MARRWRIVWSELAEELLSDAVGFLAARSPAAARQFLQDVEDAADSLAYFAERGRRVPEFARSDLREIFVHRFRLMYLVLDDEVLVVAFVHGRRRL